MHSSSTSFPILLTDLCSGSAANQGLDEKQQGEIGNRLISVTGTVENYLGNCKTYKNNIHLSLEKAICRTSTFVAMAPDLPQSFL